MSGYVKFLRKPTGRRGLTSCFCERNEYPKTFHVRTTHLENFHESCDIEFCVECEVVDVGDEVGDLLLEEVKLLFNLIQGVFVITVADAFVVVVRPLIGINTVLFLRLGIIGSTARRAVGMA